MNKNLVEMSYWESLNKNISFRKIESENIIKKWILRHFEPVNNGTCIEIGCFPGRYLTIFGDLGYELNGIDLIPRTDTELPQWLRKEKYKVDKFIIADFLDYEFDNQQFDIVYSLGFIEHFTNWKSVVIKHCSIVKQNGFIIIETPNFRGFIQKMLHYTLDRVNYSKHNIHSMNPDLWEQLLIDEGFTIIDKGYFQGFHFWVEEQERNWIQKILIKVIYKSFPLLKRILFFNSRHFSSYCGIIAKKDQCTIK